MAKPDMKKVAASRAAYKAAVKQRAFVAAEGFIDVGQRQQKKQQAAVETAAGNSNRAYGEWYRSPTADNEKKKQAAYDAQSAAGSKNAKALNDIEFYKTRVNRLKKVKY